MFQCWVKEEGQKERTVVTVWVGGRCVCGEAKLKNNKTWNVLMVSNDVTQVSCTSSFKKQSSLILCPCCNQLHPKISGGKIISDTAMLKMTQTKKWQL